MNPGPKEQEEGQIKNAVYKDLYNEEFESLDASLGKADTYNQGMPVINLNSRVRVYNGTKN
jgi:hypothetical protein